jgi:outer membrane biosynthesis protein TonB
MADAALDREDYVPSPMMEWYGERPFKVAFAVSVAIHATLIAFIPGFRSVAIETPPVLEVQIVPEKVTPPPRIQEKPVVARKTVEPKIEPIPEPVALQPRPEPIPEPEPEPVVRQPQPEPSPEPVLRRTQPERPPAPLTDIIRKPQIDRRT